MAAGVIDAAEEALEAHELIKVSVLKNCDDDPKELAVLVASLLSPARLDEADQRFSALTGEEQSTLKSLLTKLLCSQSGENRS